METALLGRPSRVRANTGTKQPNGVPAGTWKATCSTPLQHSAAATRTFSAGLPPTTTSMGVRPTPVPHSVTVSPAAASALRLAAGKDSGAVSLE